MRLSDVLYQPAAQHYVQRSLRAGRLPHALIFAGPEGVGRQRFAERLARVLLCATPVDSGGDAPIEACETCEQCVMTTAGTHPDVHIVHRLLNKYHSDSSVRNRKATQLSIDVVRHFLIGPIGMRPSHAAAKVFIVAEAERMNADAQNAVLKTLEEPPNNSHVILIATSADAMLETIRSRCQTVRFGTLPTDFVSERLATARPELSGNDAAFLAELSGGSVGRALWLASVGMHERLGESAAIIEQAVRDPVGAAAVMGNAVKALSDRLKTSDDTDELGDTNLSRLAQSTQLAMLTALLREALHIAAGEAPRPFVPPAIARLAGSAPPVQLSAAIRAMGTADYHIDRSMNANLIYDSIAIGIRRAFSRTADAA